MVELGESVGILAAQSIGEPGTQLTMRTFHTGGVFSGEVAKTILSPKTGLATYETKSGGKKIYTKFKEKAFLTLKSKILTITENKTTKAFITLPKNTIVFVKPKEIVFEKQIIAEIYNNQDKKKNQKKITQEIKEIKARISGQIYFENKIKNNSKERLWIVNRNLLSYASINENLIQRKYFTNTKFDTSQKVLKKKLLSTKPPQNSQDNYKLNICSKYIKKVTKINNKRIANFRYYKYSIKKVILEKKELIINKTSKEKLLLTKERNSKIGQFLNNETKLKENKRNKYSSLITQKRKNIISVTKANPYVNLNNKKKNLNKLVTIKKNNILFYTYFKIQKTEDIVQGLPKIEELLEAKKTFNLEKITNNPHEKLTKKFNFYKKNFNNEIACRKSLEKIQFYLIEKIQNVYASQGVKISRKHMEIIVKQMTSKVIITNPGNTSILNGEILPLNKIEEINKDKNAKVKYEPIIMGITKLSLSNQSFISEASFQETTKVLTRSAIQGKIDWLQGLKENLIMGNLIPAGTGYKK